MLMGREELHCKQYFSKPVNNIHIDILDIVGNSLQFVGAPFYSSHVKLCNIKCTPNHYRYLKLF